MCRQQRRRSRRTTAVKTNLMGNDITFKEQPRLTMSGNTHMSLSSAVGMCKKGSKSLQDPECPEFLR